MSCLPMIDLTDTPINERTTRRINFKVLDEDGVGIPAASIDTITVTLFEERDEAFINSRDHVDIKNTNGGELDRNGEDGLGGWTMDPEDNQIVRTASKEEEYHIALFEWTYSAGNKDGKQPVRLKVLNLQHVS